MKLLKKKCTKKIKIKKCDIKFENCNFKYGSSENMFLDNLNMNIVVEK